MSAYFLKARAYVFSHKFISAIALLVIVGGGWYAYDKATTASAQTRYVVGVVERGTVVSSVSASGQISASNQVDLKPKASGDITYVGVKAGQMVKAGQLLVRLDSGDAADELETAQLNYQKVVTVDPGDLRDAQNTVTQTQEDIDTDYASAHSALTKASTDMTNTTGGLEDLYHKGGYLASTNNNLDSTAKQYRKKAEDAWNVAEKVLDSFNKDYSAAPAGASSAQTDALLREAFDTASSVAQAAKYAQDAVSYIRDHDNTSDASGGSSAYSSVSSLTSTANSTVSSISSAQNSIVSDKRTLVKAQDTLADVANGPDEVDRRSEALGVRQKQEALADYSVYAPFDGVIASVDAQVGDSGSSGTSVATIITRSQIAEVSLNEVDAAKVKAGQKATLTFDAFDDLTLTGTVAEVDAIGEVSSGVVSYGVQIALDAQDSRIKPGMTVNASIQTDTAQDVLVVPSSAVKTSAGQAYVLAFEEPVATSSMNAAGVVSSIAPIQIPVLVGISDDTSVEILSGLTEGEQVITRTIAASSAATAAATTRAGGTTGTRAGGSGGAAPAGAVLRTF